MALFRSSRIRGKREARASHEVAAGSTSRPRCVKSGNNDRGECHDHGDVGDKDHVRAECDFHPASARHQIVQGDTQQAAGPISTRGRRWLCFQPIQARQWGCPLAHVPRYGGRRVSASPDFSRRPAVVGRKSVVTILAPVSVEYPLSSC